MHIYSYHYRLFSLLFSELYFHIEHRIHFINGRSIIDSILLALVNKSAVHMHTELEENVYTLNIYKYVSEEAQHAWCGFCT